MKSAEVAAVVAVRKMHALAVELGVDNNLLY